MPTVLRIVWEVSSTPYDIHDENHERRVEATDPARLQAVDYSPPGTYRN
jgi:hypothetical protein